MPNALASKANPTPPRKRKKGGDRELTAQDIRDAARGAQDALEYFNKHGKLPATK